MWTMIKVKMRNKRYLKRQSCVSNPEKKTFRTLARSSLSNTSASRLTSDKGLTKENLKLHDTTDAGMTKAFDVADDTNITADNTTVYSQITQFTNETFADINRFFNSNHASHKEVSGLMIYDLNSLEFKHYFPFLY